MFRRMMSLLLAVVMVISMVPAQVFATEAEVAETTEETVAETAAAETGEEETVAETAAPSVPEETEAPWVPEETMPVLETLPEVPVWEEELPRDEFMDMDKIDWDALVASGYCGAGENGVPGTNLSWKLYMNGTLVIEGSGAMMDYAEGQYDVDENSYIPHSTAPWDYYQHHNSHNCDVHDHFMYGVGRVVLPEGLTHIGDYAFYRVGFQEGTVIELPGTVESIGKYSFAMTAVAEIVIPDGVTIIPESAFMASGLENVILPETLVEIGKEAFNFCRQLKKVTLPESVTKIGEKAFYACWVLEEINIPEGITEIEPGTFGLSYELRSITLPEGLTKICKNAFLQSGLTAVTIPESVQEVGYYAFSDCPDLAEITVSSDQTKFERLVFTGSPVRSVTFGENCTKIPSYFCYQWAHLESIFIPDHITEICEAAFVNCTGLKEIVIPNTVQKIGKDALAGCTALERVILPDHLTSLPHGLFQYCAKLKTVDLPDGMTDIGSAFWNCTGLETLVVPAGVTKGFTFDGCSSLKDIRFLGTLTEIGSDAFRYCSSLEEMVIPNTVEYFGPGAFEGCTSLRRVVLPDNLPYLDENTFKDCVNLISVNLPDSITEIGYRAFQNCTSLPGIILPEKLEYIMDDAFNSCTSLTTVSRSGEMVTPGVMTLTGWLYISVRAFANCDSLLKLNAKDAYLNMHERYAFIECDSLQEIHIGNTSYIGVGTFENCKNLRRIYFWDEAGMGFNDRAFYGCDQLTDVYVPVSKDRWEEKLQYVGEENDPIYKATIHYDGELEGGSCGSTGGTQSGVSYQWTMSNTLRITGTGAMKDYAFETDVPWYSYRKQIRKVEIGSGITHIGSHAFEGMYLEEIKIPYSVTSIGDYAFRRSGVDKIVYEDTMRSWKAIAVGLGNEVLQKAKLEAIPIEEAIDNTAIVINEKGRAYAYYLTMPGTRIYYNYNGDKYDGTGDADGILTVDLGDYAYSKSGKNEYPITVTFTQYDEKVLEKPIVMEAKVRVLPLKFSQSWELSFDKSVTVGKKLGVGIGVGPVDLKAGVGVSLEGKTGRSINIKREYEDNAETLELTGDFRGGFGVEGSAGVGLDLDTNGIEKKSKISLAEVSAGVSAQTTGTYGLRAKNYSPDKPEQRRAVATFFLGELLMSQCQNNQMIMALYQYLIADNVYRDSGCEVIYGAAVETAAKVGADVLKVEVCGSDLFEDSPATGGKVGGTVLAGAGEIVYATGHKEYYSGDKGTPSGEYEVKAELVTKNAVDIFKGVIGNEVSGDDLSYEGVFLPLEVQSPEWEWSYKKDGTKESVELKKLEYDKQNPKVFYTEQTVTSNYKSYILNQSQLEELRYFAGYSSKTVQHADTKQIMDTARVIQERQEAVAYERSEKNELARNLTFGLSVAAGLELGAKLQAAYKEDTDVVIEKGMVTQDGTFTTSKSDDLAGLVSSNKHGFWDLFTDAIAALASDMLEAFDQAWDKFSEGVKTRWLEIRGNPDADTNLVVSVTTAKNSGEDAASYAVSACMADTMTVNGIRRESSSPVLRKTIGRAAMISVYDTVPENAVNDFSDTPLTCIIRYDEADLEAAGLNKLSPAVQDKQIAMYRYIEEGDYFEFIGGENDPEAMTVTAQITKAGQYVLAVDSCAPQLVDLTMSDHGSNPTISAYVDDLSGMDMDKFLFAIAGVTLVDGGNIRNHFEPEIGKFTYEVTGDGLGDGEHTMSFVLADTAGNSETYEYTFVIDLNAPVIDEVTVTGSTNENSAVQIRARVSDENLSQVSAVFSRLQADGQWSEEAAAAMVQLEDGTWALDYVGDGRSIRVYVRATDIGGNRVETETFEVKPYVEKVEISEEYVALRVGQTYAVYAKVSPVEFASQVTWRVDDTTVLSVDENGKVTAVGVGTGYVFADVTDGENTWTARCRIDVMEALVLNGVQLNKTTATSELFSTAYTDLEVLLKLPQNGFMSTENQAEVRSDGVAIEDAWFTEEALAKLFHISVLDDRRIQLIPTDYAVAHPKEVKSKYVSTVKVTVHGKEYETDKLTLTVKQTKPKLKGTVAAFNSFYAGQTEVIQITGATPTDIYADDAKATAIPGWLTLKNGTLMLNENAPAKSVSGKAYLLVDTEQWRIPAAVTLSVKNTYKVSGVKLSATTVTVPNLQESSAVELKLLCTNKADTIEDLNITGISASAGCSIKNFNPQTGIFKLVAENGFRAGKISIEVSFGEVTKVLTLTVKTQTVKLKLSASKVTLNKKLDNEAEIDVVSATGGYALKNDAVVVASPAQVIAKYADGKLSVKLNQVDDPDTVENEAAAYGKTYKVTIRAYEGAPAVTLGVAVPAEKKSNVTASIKAAGTIDVIRADSAVTVTPAFTNAFPTDVDAMALNVYKKSGKTWEKMTENIPFRIVKEDGTFRITGAEGLLHTDKYRLELSALVGGTEVVSKPIDLKIKMGTAKLTARTSDTVLFAQDKHDRVVVSFEKTDASLKDVARVEFKNAKQAAQFEILDYGNGTYAIGFKDGNVDKSLIGKTVTVSLNIFLEGNLTAKANTTASVKLTVVK